MIQRPPQPPPLDAEERALAKALPRLHGRTAPGPDLDASILAAAQAAVHPVKPSRAAVRPRIRWIGPAALAASVVLAVGMAWQLRPLPRLQAAQPAATSDLANTASVRRIESAPYARPMPNVQSKVAPAEISAPARPQAMPPAIDSQEASTSSQDRSLQTPADRRAATDLSADESAAASTPPPPPAPPPPAAAIAAKAAPGVEATTASSGNTLDTQAVDRTLGARTAAPAAAASSTNDAMLRDAAPAGGANKPGTIGQAQQPAAKALAPPPAPPALRNEAKMAADVVDDHDDDVPPATVDSPAVRDAWLHRIGELLEQGKRLEAKASLAEFRRRYPAAVLPSRLHALEIEP